MVIEYAVHDTTRDMKGKKIPAFSPRKEMWVVVIIIFLVGWFVYFFS